MRMNDIWWVFLIFFIPQCNRIIITILLLLPLLLITIIIIEVQRKTKNTVDILSCTLSDFTPGHLYIAVCSTLPHSPIVWLHRLESGTILSSMFPTRPEVAHHSKSYKRLKHFGRSFSKRLSLIFTLIDPKTGQNIHSSSGKISRKVLNGT